jgi:hypothetical protein
MVRLGHVRRFLRIKRSPPWPPTCDQYDSPKNASADHPMARAVTHRVLENYAGDRHKNDQEGQTQLSRARAASNTGTHAQMIPRSVLLDGVLAYRRVPSAGLDRAHSGPAQPLGVGAAALRACQTTSGYLSPSTIG